MLPSPDFQPFLRHYLLAEAQAGSEDKESAAAAAAALDGEEEKKAPVVDGNVTTLATACLAAMDHLLDLGGNAHSIMDADEISDLLDSPDMVEGANRARRALVVDRKAQLGQVKHSYEAMQKIGAAASFPEELAQLLEMSSKFGVDTAWEKLQATQVTSLPLSLSVSAAVSLFLCCVTLTSHCVFSPVLLPCCPVAMLPCCPVALLPCCPCCPAALLPLLWYHIHEPTHTSTK